MAAGDLAAVFTLPPTDAISYFKSKGYAITFNWRELWKEAHTQAFTVAGVLKLDVLTDIRNGLEKALENGTTSKQFIKELKPTLQSKGWWGKGLIVNEDTGEISGKKLNPQRLELIFRTNTQTAYMAGRYERMLDNAEDRPYWQYNAVMDSHTRQEHARLNGRIFRYDDPVWRHIFPPNGFNCRCSVRALSEDDIERLGLSVSSSEGRISFVEREIAPNDTRKIMVYDDPVYGKMTVTDMGFDYNPALRQYQPDLNASYPANLVAAYQQEYKGIL